MSEVLIYNQEQGKELCKELTQQKYIDECKQGIEEAILDESPSNIDFKKFFENRDF